MKTLVQMIMMGTLTGGACWPAMEPMARIAAVAMRGIPIFIRMGAIMTPVVSTQAGAEPVTIPGNMMMSIKKDSSTLG